MNKSCKHQRLIEYTGSSSTRDHRVHEVIGYIGSLNTRSHWVHHRSNRYIGQSAQLHWLVEVIYWPVTSHFCGPTGLPVPSREYSSSSSTQGPLLHGVIEYMGSLGTWGHWVQGVIGYKGSLGTWGHWVHGVIEYMSVTSVGGAGSWVQISTLILQHFLSVRVSQNTLL